MTNIMPRPTQYMGDEVGAGKLATLEHTQTITAKSTTELMPGRALVIADGIVSHAPAGTTNVFGITRAFDGLIEDFYTDDDTQVIPARGDVSVLTVGTIYVELADDSDDAFEGAYAGIAADGKFTVVTTADTAVGRFRKAGKAGKTVPVNINL